MKTIEELRAALEAEPARSAWDKGVKVYASEFIDDLEEAIKGGYFDFWKTANSHELRAQLLNGASSWSQYSYGGSSLIYDADIAEQLCSPSELKKVKGGERRPNSREEWLDVQERALSQAAHMICRLAK